MVTFGVNGEDLGFERIISRYVKVLPGCNLVLDGDAQGLGLSPVHLDHKLRQFSFVPGFEDFRTGLDRVPNGWGTWRQLTVRSLGPVIGRQNNGQAISSDVNPSGVDVNPVVGGDGG